MLGVVIGPILAHSSLRLDSSIWGFRLPSLPLVGDFAVCLIITL